MKLTLIKAIVYRLIIILTQFIYLYVTTGDTTFSVNVASIFGIFATIEYIAMERYWDKLVLFIKQKINGETK